VTVIGKQLGHYLLIERLGSGGMGDVFVAHDTKLDRRVALKLPRQDDLASVDRLGLFRREARAVAALNHPGIVHIYSVEDADGLTFITMELVSGRSLRQALDAQAPFAVPRTLAIARGIAEGLASAHAAGVLHRDLKPANVMITDDERVKILDFGVAKFFRPGDRWDAEAGLTATDLSFDGNAVGTIGYMSPEQALGKPLDARSDLFALGVMLFEMATGKAPFAGGTPAAVFDQLLNRQPSSSLTLNPSLPQSLAAVIDKALEKDPGRRHSTADELLAALKRIDPAATERTIPATIPDERTRLSSIVVLPFADLSPLHDHEYFCHGITEEIINTLASVPGLRVISRTSAFAFRGQDLDVTEIGRRLRVGTALEGSVRTAGDRVRVTAQLVHAEGGHQIWAQRFDRELSDVFAIQDEIASTIVKELRLELAGRPRPARISIDVTAHDLYLKGMYALNKWTHDSMRQAMADFRDSIAHDSRFAPAYAALAEGLNWLYSGLGVLPASDAVAEARWAVDKALENDPDLADAHRMRGLIAMNHDWDRSGARDGLTRALQLGPGSAAAHLWNAWRLALLERRYDAALRELEEAERLDPLDLQLKTLIGYVHRFHHDSGRAIAQFQKVLELEPAFAFAHYALGDAWTELGQYDRAFAEYDRAMALGGRSANNVGVLGYAYGRSGHIDRAKEHLRELTERAGHSYVSPMWTALVHLGLGDLDGVFQCLERAFEERDGSLILITAAVEFDPVREDPRFRSLLDRMELGDLASPRA
jgi:serine/threonine protein kinase/tetratricopeptide (TPR) repeat protein